MVGLAVAERLADGERAWKVVSGEGGADVLTGNEIASENMRLHNKNGKIYN